MPQPVLPNDQQPQYDPQPAAQYEPPWQLPGSDPYAAGAQVPYAGAPYAPQPPRGDVTFIERLLGGDWRPALWIVLPTFGSAVAVAVFASLSQLFAGTSLYAPTFVQYAYRDVGAWFHAIPQLVAQAFGSPSFEDAGGGTFLRGNSPLTITVAAVIIFALLLRRRCADRSGRERAVLAIRCVVLVSTLLTVLSLFATATAAAYSGSDADGSLYSYRLTTTVSPGRVLGWSLLVFTLVAAAVAGRPLAELARRAPRLKLGEWRPALFGAVIATAVSVALGFVAAVVTGFVHVDDTALQDRGDVARLLPLSVGHGVDLGVNGWTVATLGRVGDNRASGEDLTLSLFDRHGLSAWYFLLVLIPVVSVAVAAMAIRRRYADLGPRVLSRACYRMSLPIAGLFLVLAIPSRAHNVYSGGEDSGYVGHVGPQVLLGTLFILVGYVILGFGAGRVLLAASTPRAAAGGYGAAPGAGYSGYGGYGTAGVYPTAVGAHADRPVRSPNPIVVGAVCAIVMLGGVVAAVLLQGGKSAPGGPTGSVVAADIPSDSGSYDSSYSGTYSSEPSYSYEPSYSDEPSYSYEPSYGSSDDSSYSYEVQLQNQHARATLTELATAEESYYSDNSYYALDESDLYYTEPDDVFVYIRDADSSSFCAVATGTDDEAPYYTYDSDDGYVKDGDSC